MKRYETAGRLLALSAMDVDPQVQRVAREVAEVVALRGRKAGIEWLRGYWYPTGTRTYTATLLCQSILGDGPLPPGMVAEKTSA